MLILFWLILRITKPNVILYILDRRKEARLNWNSVAK